MCIIMCGCLRVIVRVRVLYVCGCMCINTDICSDEISISFLVHQGSAIVGTD